MKKIFVFILFLSLLIAAEYFFLTEIFTQRRLHILGVSLVVLVLCIVSFVRYFKKAVYPREHF